MIIPHFLYDPAIINLAIIISLFILTYIRILGKDFYWVIDDLEGIARFSETWRKEIKRNPKTGLTRAFDELDYDKFEGDVIPEEKIDSYDLDGKQVKYLQFIPQLGFPGNILRFLRLHIGKQYRIIAKNKKGHDVYGFVQSPVRHHILSMLVQVCNLTLAYLFLSKIIPVPIAFGACLLYAVHPLTTQGVAWISGINYNLSLFFSLLLLNVSMLFLPEIKYAVIAILSFLSVITIYTGGFTCILMWFLGFKVEAIIAGVIALGIIYIKGKETKDFRVKAFKEQNMHQTTSLNWRKPIVMLKTTWYYMRLVFVPIKMGLYHTWGYFYDETIERVDKMFWFGLLTILGFSALFYYGNLAVRFGVLWYFSYFFLFSNFITAQQFVADRYVMIPSFGICIILSALLYGTPFFWILLGFYIMRTFLHLPSFKNEVDFYGSNFLNFRKSEVSLGNMGVAFINQGMHGAAVDTWMLATKINPLYDVPWYNLYSVFKGNGRLVEARDFLKKCLDAKVVHFDKRWTEELAQLDAQLSARTTMDSPARQTEQLYYQAAELYKHGSTALELQVLRAFMVGDTAGLIPDMITQVKARLAELEKQDSVQLHNPVQEPTRPEVAGTGPVDQGTGVPAGSN